MPKVLYRMDWDRNEICVLHMILLQCCPRKLGSKLSKQTECAFTIVARAVLLMMMSAHVAPVLNRLNR